MSRSRSIVALALAVALIPQPGYAAPAPQPVQPTGTATPAADPSTPVTTTGIGTQPAPGAPDTLPEDAAGTPPGDAPIPPEGETPAEGETPDAVPVEEAAQPEEPPPPAETLVPEGPERPPEPTLGNGKYKAKGTGLLIAGGALLGLGVVGVVTSAVLTRCTELDNSFACKNRQHNTFAVPATATVALLGAVLLFVGLAYRARYKRWERWTPGAAKTAFQPTGNGFTLKF